MPGIYIPELDAASNYWRGKTPSPDGVTPSELRALAEGYAGMGVPASVRSR